MNILNFPKTSWSLNEWLHYIEHLHPHYIDLNLDRIKHVANRLDLLIKPAPFIFTVSGTNGKGTTCHMLEILLIAMGYRVGVYSSPHLLHYTERIRIQGTALNKVLHCNSFANIEAHRGDILLTYFEFSTLSALYLFREANLDVVILEVGLGGRLDATNIIDSDIAIITCIALEHTKLLGNNLESIGREKAGIFRKGKPAIVGETNIIKSLIDVALEKKARLLQCNRDWQWKKISDKWILQDTYGELYDLSLPQIPLQNAATALTALRASNLKLNEDIIRKYLPLVTLPGRFQIIQKFPHIILDVMHNPHAACYVASRLKEIKKTSKLHVVIGMLNDKNIKNTLAALLPQVNYWYCVSLNGPRGVPAKKLMSYLNSGESFDNVADAWKAVFSRVSSKDIILVCGSFHTVALVMQLIKENN
ncbi:bifunctional tetrahydrofolate synthase/dihydrofolate synthase [Pantoea sp. Aalb]|uniref:bifunctional tetrahydrofolate synthase/dihydrofolate synthase n=1 Tax=Pantoea sp. Aalb TaxID=2576762 RepID=UPI001328D0A3|nr:bifunctional tetrahydrofolate synthase/dihydrofolate synthase [Pantoea sp. Aalb]MXP67297.1 bifunctional tetrahydrofolate synthase/dihydrofolate synthase [Pantoea sp. Aalb]